MTHLKITSLFHVFYEKEYIGCYFLREIMRVEILKQYPNHVHDIQLESTKRALNRDKMITDRGLQGLFSIHWICSDIEEYPVPKHPCPNCPHDNLEHYRDGIGTCGSCACPGFHFRKGNV